MREQMRGHAPAQVFKGKGEDRKKGEVTTVRSDIIKKVHK